MQIKQTHIPTALLRNFLQRFNSRFQRCCFCYSIGAIYDLLCCHASPDLVSTLVFPTLRIQRACNSKFYPLRLRIQCQMFWLYRFSDRANFCINKYSGKLLSESMSHQQFLYFPYVLTTSKTNFAKVIYE